MRTLAQTGNGWMTFKDTANRTSNQTGRPGNVIHLSNLCTEILEVSSNDETAVCNLGSINLGGHLARRRGRLGPAARDGADRRRLPRPGHRHQLLPQRGGGRSNPRWRPVGLGVMGLQDVFFALRLPFDAAEARELSTRLAEEIYLTALETSASLAAAEGPHPAYGETRAAGGVLQPDLWGVTPTQAERWQALRERIRGRGLRNSLLVAIAPTATIASIAGCYECIEPQLSNTFKRETLSGEFLQVNAALVGELKRLGRWTPEVRDRIKRDDGSVQGIDGLPDDVKALFRTAWELPQRSLIDLAAARGPYVDQSQSLNLFLASPTIGKLSSMYRYAWQVGLKTTYYLRSRPATRIQQATVEPRTGRWPGRSPAPWRTPRAARRASDHSPPPRALLDPGLDLTLRPMRYPRFYEQFRDAIKNTWTVEEVDLHNDLKDLARLAPAERHMVSRLVAFFATGDTIVANNLVLNLYQHVNSPEARLYLSRQLFEEAVHVQFYLTLLDTYLPDERERHEAFTAIESIPSIHRKADFCFRWIDSAFALDRLETREQRRPFLLNLICFAACIEGLFFYGAFAYVYFLRSRGLLNGLASGTNWVFRDESMHMAFAFDVVETVRVRNPTCSTRSWRCRSSACCARRWTARRSSPRTCSAAASPGCRSTTCVATSSMSPTGGSSSWGCRRPTARPNPLAFMDLQDVQELANFFERRVSAYQVAVTGSVDLDADF